MAAASWATGCGRRAEVETGREMKETNNELEQRNDGNSFYVQDVREVATPYLQFVTSGPADILSRRTPPRVEQSLPTNYQLRRERCKDPNEQRGLSLCYPAFMAGFVVSPVFDLAGGSVNKREDL
ncbi:hypothetical protein O3P69_005828 [Scylla paramamosain]|uniref:Uncharacterized protein n=1 Tax=Scylla paramamosain TaxID=85552 RepID=A0AAW0U4Y4_SCYPA